MGEGNCHCVNENKERMEKGEVNEDKEWKRKDKILVLCVQVR